MGQVATLVYDADCAMCRASALWLMRRAMAAGELEILPCRSGPRRARFPELTEERCMRAMQLILPDGRILEGADAVPELLTRIPRWRWAVPVLALPGVRPVARRAYAWIAAHRMRISCALGREGRA